MAREWWIDPDYDGYFDDTNENLIARGFVRAIEKSAYDKLKKNYDDHMVVYGAYLDEQKKNSELDNRLYETFKVLDQLESALQFYFEMSGPNGRAGKALEQLKKWKAENG